MVKFHLFRNAQVALDMGSLRRCWVTQTVERPWFAWLQRCPWQLTRRLRSLQEWVAVQWRKSDRWQPAVRAVRIPGGLTPP